MVRVNHRIKEKSIVGHFPTPSKKCRLLSSSGKNSVRHFPTLRKIVGHFPSQNYSANFQPKVSDNLRFPTPAPPLNSNHAPSYAIDLNSKILAGQVFLQKDCLPSLELLTLVGVFDRNSLTHSISGCPA